MFHSVFNSRLCDLVKCNSVRLVHIKTEQGGKVPGDSLSLTVRVGCEINFVRLGNHSFKLLDELFFALDHCVFRGKIVLYIDAQLRRREVTDMTHGSGDIVAVAEIFFYCLNLCG